MHRALADETRSQLLRILRDAPEPLDTQGLAERCGLHPTTIHAHLRVLVEAGLVTSRTEERTLPGRPRRLYDATEDGFDGAEAGGYRLLAEMLVSHMAGTSPDVTRDALTAGRAWGTYFVDRPPPYTTTSTTSARADVVDLMDRLGFRPELHDDDRILLRRCPFFEVAQPHQDVVCSLHLGIIQGALQALGVPPEAGELEPFVQPALCVAHVTGATG